MPAPPGTQRTDHRPSRDQNEAQDERHPMDDLKPWHIVLLVAAIGVLGYSVFRFVFSSGPDLPDTVLLVDVKSGDLFRLDVSGRKAGYYPEKHPDTGDRSLLPVRQLDDGTWVISPHSLPALEDVKGETPAVTDANGTVEVTNTNARKLSR